MRITKRLRDDIGTTRLVRFSNQQIRRVVLIAILLLGCALIYSLVLTRFDVSEEPEERHFGVASSDARIELYLQPMAIDPVNDSMHMRISVLPARSAGSLPVTVADRDLVLMIHHGTSTEQIRVQANQPFPEATFAFDLSGGSVRDYPLDSYHSEIQLAGFEAGHEGADAALPTRVTCWEGVLGYSVRGEELAAARVGQVQLRFTVKRVGAIEFFGLAVYGGMIVLAVCALAVGALVFVGVRRIEVTLVGALGAIVFALPAMRNALPGGVVALALRDEQLHPHPQLAQRAEDRRRRHRHQTRGRRDQSPSGSAPPAPARPRRAPLRGIGGDDLFLEP